MRGVTDHCFREEKKMSRVGGLTKKFYRETGGIKVSGGQPVKCGTVLTRQGDRWKAGLNVTGRTHLTAGCNGEVYFTRKRGNGGKITTYIHVRSTEKPKK